MKKLGILIAALLLPPCLPALAQDTRPTPPQQPESVHYGWADVLRVDPVYDDAGPPPSAPPREECYEEQSETAPAPADNRAGGTVLGAIVGGVIGHSFGKGSGRAATTAAGAVAGAAIGNGVAESQQQEARRGYTTERHCRIVDSPGGARHIVAYDIEYRYRGELYTSRMNYDPGDRLRVRITVMPAE